ncbi:MAG: SAM-dependent methyltransferase [Gammaproteobacteria bacterium]
MIPAQASRTALRVALHRAAHQLLDKPVVFVDPLAVRILGSKAEGAFRADPAQYDTTRFAPQMRAFMAVRARLAEEQIAQARTAGVRQVVILGAGLDTLAYRSAAEPPVTIWEVDHPATQAWKRDLLAAAGIDAPAHLKLVAADLTCEPLEGVLAAAGFDAHSGAVFSWLGVTQYLNVDAVFATLRYVAGVTAAAGGIAFDYSIAPELLSLPERLAYDALAARVSAVGEPWLSHFVPAELVAALTDTGFAVARDLDPQELLERYVGADMNRLRLGRLARLMWAGAAPYVA